MTRAEIIKIMSVLRGAYPQFYRNVARAEAEDTIALWAAMFAEDDAGLVGAAVKALIATDSKGFPPVIGQIKAKMRLLTERKGMDEAEAWSLVANAIRNSGYEAKQEFDKLPPEIQRIVGSPNQLRDWSQMDSDMVHSVVASNFQRAYRTRKAAAAEYSALPQSVKALMLESGCKLLEE